MILVPEDQKLDTLLVRDKKVGGSDTIKQDRRDRLNLSEGTTSTGHPVRL